METIAFRSSTLGLVSLTLPRYAVGYFAFDADKGTKTAVVVVLKRQDMLTTYQARDYALKELGRKREDFTPTSGLPIGKQKGGTLTLYSFALFSKHERGANFVAAESSPDIGGSSVKNAESLIKQYTGIDVMAVREALAAELKAANEAKKEADQKALEEERRLP